MTRLSISFYIDVSNKLHENAAHKQISIAHYVRDLVDIGLRVEEAAAQKKYGDNNHRSEVDELGDLKKLWENDLSWLLESLYLIRYLIRHLPHSEELSPEDKNQTDDIISMAKNKAQSYVKGLFCEKL
jgi:hypothetical protein